jgi:hypothetical protein
VSQSQETLDSTLELLLDLEADGSVTAPEREQLEAAATRPGVAERRRELSSLHQRLAASRVEARPGFREQVLAALEPAGWEARHRRAWKLPVAAMVVLGSLAAMLLGRSAAEDGAAVGLASALSDFLVAVAVAGGGLATASWQGLHLTLTDLVGASVGTQIAFVVLALGANAALFAGIRSVLRRARASANTRAIR